MNLKRLVFAAKYRLYRPGAFQRHRELEISQYLPVEEQLVRQRARFRTLVAHVCQHVPFYRDRYAAVGFKPGEMADEDFFERLPILTKVDIQAHFDELTCRNLTHHGAASTTGGSTGTPVTILSDRRLLNEALSWRMQDWWGLDPGDDGAFVWRTRRSSPVAEFLNQFLWFPTRKIRLDAAEMTPEAVEAFLARFNAVRPPLLQGYVGAVCEVAAFARRKDIALHRPQAIWLTSSPITPVQRSQVESAFQAPVYDQYGCSEVPFIAAQCGVRGGLHVNSETCLLEIVDAGNRRTAAGAFGRILVTKLDEFVFPLIRYEVGDRGRWLPGACPCGVRLPLLDQVKGRTSDLVRLPSGAAVGGDYLTTIFDGCPGEIEAFRVVQTGDGAITVEYVPAPAGCSDASIARVQRDLERHVDREVPVRMRRVPGLAHDRGKLRFVVSELADQA